MFVADMACHRLIEIAPEAQFLQVTGQRDRIQRLVEGGAEA